MYLIIGEVDGYIEEKNESKYFVFDSTDKSKKVLEKHTELWDGIKNENKTINGGKEGEYGKDFVKLVYAIFYLIFIFSSNESPLQTMKNVFYFI